MTKTELLTQIRITLQSELKALTKAAQESFSAATDPDSKAENKYDTRSLEASYVARGQAQRVEELQAAIQAFENLPNSSSASEPRIGLGALICLAEPEGQQFYFIGPAAGGTEIMLDGHEVVVITPTSPLGQKLIGRGVGDLIPTRPGVTASVVSVV